MMEEKRRGTHEGVHGKLAVPDAVIGAVTGDIVGSVYEFHNIKRTDFPFWSDGSRFTDDTVMTIAVYSALKEYISGGRQGDLHPILIRKMKEIGRRYPDCGYGGRFIKWTTGLITAMATGQR